MSFNGQNEDRKSWLSEFAHAELSDLEAFLDSLGRRPSFEYLRKPESGLIMVRGRMGGTGNRFNLGEATVSRCSVKLDGGSVGHGYVIGRSQRKAEVIAVLDALLQGRVESVKLLDEFLRELGRKRARRREDRGRKTAATRVNFLTMNEL